ncbi:Inositol polyphosphate multikinase [Pseudolycoriella hygida]|uniref:Kinase n=1 Tax=Pseudolycoriella hygida TaxID=35572 RepID=A0A9Q0NEC3_9DIPT|nr:Inositol polyphosphate multikinase [Pseudolycoriella hygida]
MSINATKLDLPSGMEPLDNQVAGHTFQVGKGTLGIIKNKLDGSILKSSTKELCREREIKFYEQLKLENDVNSMLLKELVPEYRGTEMVVIDGKPIEFIKLVDVTHGMTEPCVIDIKIGKRTWDPMASQEKILVEEQKYKVCKERLGFCIPGFQVYDISNGRIKRYGKEYGKKLNETTVKDGLRIFLNSENGGMCRPLLMQLLTGMWKVQKWARLNKSLRIYCSSLLLAYDARRLRNVMLSNSKNNSSTSLNSSPTFQLKTPTSADKTGVFTWPNLPTENVQQVYKKVQRCHSEKNNYDEDLKSIKENYSFMLGNLIDGHEVKEWAFVKMIDFAHVFPAEADCTDSNYLFGIENLVKIFEDFLKECD